MTTDAPERSSSELRRQAVRVDAAYREWAQDRDDVQRLRLLREVIDEYLDSPSVFPRG